VRYLPFLVLTTGLVTAGLDVARAHDNTPKSAQAPESALLVKPYLQLGYAPARGTLQLLWHGADTDIDWSVEYRLREDKPWARVEAPSFRRVAVGGVEPHRVYRATLLNLDSGSAFAYKLKAGGAEVFAAEARAPKAPDQPYRFAVFGDCGAGSSEQKPIAYQAALAKPDFLSTRTLTSTGPHPT
jgi:hypothetical protein